MLNENLKSLRKSKGLSQEELAIKCNVVRQTISKWEQGLSVPDSEMLLTLSEVLGAPVSTLLGENIAASEADELKTISAKLEVINLQFAKRKAAKRKALHWIFICASIFLVLIFAVLLLLGSPYLGWDYANPEVAVVGTFFHGFEFVFVRVAPICLILTVVGAVLTRNKK